MSGLATKMDTDEVDNLSAEICATMTTKHPDYAVLAARICITNLHRETKDSFSSKYNNGHYFSRICCVQLR